MSERLLTAGEECRAAAAVLNSFIDSNRTESIPSQLVVMAMGVAIVKGRSGMAVVRLKSGEWSAPCAFALHSSTGHMAADQETVILFMSERSIIALVSNAQVILNQTHSFLPGPFHSHQPVESVDMFVYVRYNNGFTPPDLVMSYMTGWAIGEDKQRHRHWHGAGVTWYDVLTNKISVDRSSVGNALYLVLNLVAGRAGGCKMAITRNYVETERMVGPRPSEVAASSGLAVERTGPAQSSTQQPYSLPHQQQISHGWQQAPHSQQLNSQQTQSYDHPHSQPFQQFNPQHSQFQRSNQQQYNQQQHPQYQQFNQHQLFHQQPQQQQFNQFNQQQQQMFNQQQQQQMLNQQQQQQLFNQQQQYYQQLQQNNQGFFNQQQHPQQFEHYNPQILPFQHQQHPQVNMNQGGMNPAQLYQQNTKNQQHPI